MRRVLIGTGFLKLSQLLSLFKVFNKFDINYYAELHAPQIIIHKYSVTNAYMDSSMINFLYFHTFL